MARLPRQCGMLFLHVVSHLPRSSAFRRGAPFTRCAASEEGTAMLPELTNAGIAVMSDLPWGTHFCYFYETQQDLFDATVPFLQAGLENHQFCLWMVSCAVTEAAALQALREWIPAVDRHLAEGRIEIVVHPEPDGVRFLNKKLDDALARGYTGMRVAGSPTC